MLLAVVVIFVVAYVAIALEHPININKSASALIGAGLLWTIYALGVGDAVLVEEHLGETLIEIAQIVFFLMGAMTIVEVVDAHNGFEVITSRIRTTKLTSLMWLIGFITFFLSAALDNLTTTIVMVSLVQKLLDKPAKQSPDSFLLIGRRDIDTLGHDRQPVAAYRRVEHRKPRGFSPRRGHHHRRGEDRRRARGLPWISPAGFSHPCRVRRASGEARQVPRGHSGARHRAAGARRPQGPA